MKILIVDDEPNILETVELRLRKDGYSTFTAASAEEGMRLFRLVRPDLVLLDVMLPKQSGYDMCRTIRRDSHVPVIFLTARGGEDDRVTGLEIGGDDYMVKPFSLSELSARVRSVLRRSGSSIRTLEVVETGNLIINPKTHEATMDGKAVALSPKEFALLYFLSQNPGQVFSRETLLDRVWGADAYVSSRTVDVHIRWLRERIEQNPAHPERIITIRGVGYKFQG